MSPSKLRPRKVKLGLEAAHGDDGMPVDHIRLYSPPSSFIITYQEQRETQTSQKT